ncbi:MAG: hypothetical protein ACOZAI_04150 [Pseudomonadota bacterium]
MADHARVFTDLMGIGLDAAEYGPVVGLHYAYGHLSLGSLVQPSGEGAQGDRGVRHRASQRAQVLQGTEDQGGQDEAAHTESSQKEGHEGAGQSRQGNSHKDGGGHGDGEQDSVANGVQQARLEGRLSLPQVLVQLFRPLDVGFLRFLAY